MYARLQTTSRETDWMPAWWGWHMIFWGLISVLLTIAFMVRLDMSTKEYLYAFGRIGIAGGFLFVLHGVGRFMYDEKFR